jgi:hypothetical protein
MRDSEKPQRAQHRVIGDNSKSAKDRLNPNNNPTVHIFDHPTGETEVYELESAYPHCVLPPHFFTRLLLKESHSQNQ